jgi:type I restriction enzyme R subunit
MKFNEDSRVKIPAILHLMKLGYKYLVKSEQNFDDKTNILVDIFYESIARINNNLENYEVKNALDKISLSLENEDIGKAFYTKLIDESDVKLIDFENINNNSFHVVTELIYQKEEDEFRPDITIFINGLPLVFIEVKKPNNQDGILAEHKRIETRFKNKKFRKFINLTQLMIFSNNMEYDDTSLNQIQGAFYSTTSYHKPIFNYFREEEEFNLDELLYEITEQEEINVLQDNNYISIKDNPEYLTNKKPNSPTNRILTSLLQKDRIAFILKYAFAYVNESSGLQKHIMRYPQLFATKSISKKLDEGKKNGIIWHTQGSGKTALAYYNVKYLIDYYRKKSINPKFYFIVDRIDLSKQASREFRNRGLSVNIISSREAFSSDIKSNRQIKNDDGKSEITVVNIQKFKDDPDIIKNQDYNIDIQRIFFLDEVHRSYNPQGSFLANLENADRNSVKIGLTGTPLLGEKYNSRTLFGDYIHKYYYNLSIKDGYTLRLIREEIETNYKFKLKEALEEIQILEGNSKKKIVYSHKKFVEPMLDYIVNDFEKARITHNDYTIGGMVVCDSSEQARMLLELFNKKYANNDENSIKSACVILHDIGSKQERDDWIEDFKSGKIDLLFVYNMLLTGFDAPRLKKLYIGRKIKAHNLLQTLTRVNRTYKDFRYGYVVDFADIQEEFDTTNRDYFNELQSELGSEIEHYSNLFKSNEEIEKEIKQIKEILFRFDTENAEVFSQQISEIQDRKEMLEITKVLNNAKSLYNLIRLSGKFEMLEKLDFHKLNYLSREAQNHLSLLNMLEAIDNDLDTSNLLNVALEDIIFAFTKIDESEMIIADKLKDILQKTRESLGGNFDPKDPKFVSLREELERLFKKKNLSEVTKEEMEENINALEKIYNQSKLIDRNNKLLKAKYSNDEKYARLHKRLMEKDPLTDSELKLFEILNDIKQVVDNQILNNSSMLENENYIGKMIQKSVIEQIKNKHKMDLSIQDAKRINIMIVNEYMNEYRGVYGI